MGENMRQIPLHLETQLCASYTFLVPLQSEKDT